ncbi:MAG: hypothetical protein AB7U34_06395 [Novosphingobium sp.]
MKISAILSRTCAAESHQHADRWAGSAIAAALLALAPPGAAQAQNSERERPVTDDTVTAGDVVTSPLKDLNIAKDPIPPLLIEARKAPYDREGITQCSDIAAKVTELDAILGDDLDLVTEDEGNPISAGRVAKWAVSSFIPFRGLLRELTGAKEHEQRFRDAIAAGLMRRAYLKGIGQTMKCAYPARPLTKEEASRIIALRLAEERKENDGENDEEGNVRQPLYTPGEPAK